MRRRRKDATAVAKLVADIGFLFGAPFLSFIRFSLPRFLL